MIFECLTHLHQFARPCQTTIPPRRYQHVPPSSPHFSCEVTARPARTKTSATNWEKSRPLTAKQTTPERLHSHVFLRAIQIPPNACNQALMLACVEGCDWSGAGRTLARVLVVGLQTNPCFAHEAASVHISNETVCHLRRMQRVSISEANLATAPLHCDAWSELCLLIGRLSFYAGIRRYWKLGTPTRVHRCPWIQRIV